MTRLMAAATLLLLLVAGTPIALPGGVAAAQAAGCAAFDAWEWAQSVYDADPAANAALDPDGDGVACPDLPFGAAPALWTDAVPSDATPARLIRVVDGDTIHVAVNGREETVRLLRIDTPETKDPNDPPECYGAEATAFTTWLLGLGGGNLWLERDVSERDRYGRLLRSVWIDVDGEPYLVSEAIARSGYGQLVTYPPDVAYDAEILAAQQFARAWGLGLWSACGGTDTPLGASAPAALPAPAGGVVVTRSSEIAADPAPVAQAPLAVDPNAAAGLAGNGGGCDPSYPDACIPPAPPDLNCKDVSYRRFTVLAPDPHNFDSDHDGIGCESG